MRKSSKKILTAALTTAFACSVAGGLALSTPISSFADANVMEVEGLFETLNGASLVSQNSVTLSDGATNSIKGLQVRPEQAGGAWSATLNTTFTGDTEITYFLPNQYGGNGIADTVANAFTVKNAQGQEVATFVVCGAHWSYLSTTKAYLYNNSTGVYTTQTMTYPSGGHRTYAGVGELTLGESIVHPALSGWGDTADMYVAPKVGTQVNGSLASGEDGTGSVYFDYDDTTDTLTVKTDTYKLASPATSECAGNGQVIEIGSVSADLSAGYTISVGSAPAIGSFTYKYSSSVMLTAINGVDVTGANVSAAIGDVTDIRYDGEQKEGDDNVISIFEGEELGAFDVYTKFVAGGVLQSNSATKNFEVAASESFKEKEPGTYDLTVTAKTNETQGNFTKAYKVVVLPSYAVATGSMIKPVANAKITSKKTYGQYTGVAIERINDADKQRVAMLDGVFNGEMNITYLFNGISGNDANQKEAHAIDIYNANGEKVASAVNYWVQAWQGSGSRIYLHDLVNDKFMKPTETGYSSMDTTVTVVDDKGTADTSDDTTSQVVMPKTETSMWSGVKVTPMPTTSAENINFDGTYYDVKTAEGTLHVIYDDAAKTLTLKITTVQKVRLNPNNAQNEGKTENLSNPAPLATLGVIENIDLSAGYSIGFSDPTNFNGNDNQFTQSSTSVLVTAVNGVSVVGESVSAISCGVVSATLTGETYELDSKQPTSVYIAKNATLDTLKVTVQKQMLGDWNAFAETDEVEIVGEYDLATAGEYPVTLKAVLEGIPYQTDIKLVVEESKKIAFDTDGGKLIDSIYISEHSWKYQIPTPVNYGWQFIGWFDGETQVTAITQDMAAVTLKAKWLDMIVPTVMLNGLSSYEVVDSAAAFALKKTDVLAQDEACGILGDEYITIYVKAPGASEFVEYSAFTFDSAAYGLYEVRYDVVDFSGNAASIQRTVRYTSTRPVLTVNAAVVSEATVGDNVSLPTATATLGEAALDVQISVVFEGSEVAVANGAFTADKAGVYTISYYAQDAQGAVAQQTFTVTVKAAQEPVEGPTASGCQSSVSLMASGGLVLLGAALFVDKKRKNK